jgi:hypothetical protein
MEITLPSVNQLYAYSGNNIKMLYGISLAIYTRTFKRVDETYNMARKKKLFNKSGVSVEIKEAENDVTVTVQNTTKVEPTKSETQENFNDLVSVYEKTGFTEESGQ